MMKNYMSEDQFLVAAGLLLAAIVFLIFASLIYQKNQKKLARRYLEKDKPSLGKTTSEEQAPSVSVTAPAPVSWLERLRVGLTRTHAQMVKGIDEFFLSHKDKLTREDTLEYLFELLIQADVGVKTSEMLVERVKNRLTKSDLQDAQSFKLILKEEILTILNTTFENAKGTIESPKSAPHVILLVGVNGVGKTTTTGKLAFKSSQQGKKVVIGAADTFRAAAVEQLSVWAQRSGAQMIQLKEGSDPASVAYESVKKSAEAQADVCLVDTAGRLQTRHDLMAELSKISRVLAKDVKEAPHEVLLVLDATTGQNALMQAKLFREAVQVTGLILTKLDGTAKGGIAIAIAAEMGLPIRYIGVGETVEDLEVFQAQEFVDALFAE